MRLQIADAAALLATGAADHLMQKLERALGGARVAVAEAEIGIDDADQIELGKVMAFRHKLRADDEIESPLCHVVELGAQALDRFHQVARQHQDAGAGKQFGRFLLQPLDAGADGREGIGRVAVRALRWRRHGETAMMADQPLAKAMIDQPGIAIRALQAEAAGAAERERRVAAAVQEQQRLFFAFE